MKKYLTRPWLALVLTALTAAVIYSNIYRSPFVFDDISSIVESKPIRDVSIFLSLKRLLRPRGIVDLTFALNYEFGKLDVFGYHLVNLIIHVINGWLVYFLALTIFVRLTELKNASVETAPEVIRPPPGEAGALSQDHLKALAAALIFVAHPIQTQAVTYTAQRYAAMAALFYLASVLAYLKARILQQRDRQREGPAVQSKKKRAVAAPAQSSRRATIVALYALVFFCALLAFLSKQNAASLPLTLLLVEYLVIDRTWAGWKRKLPWIGGFFIVFTIFVVSVLSFYQGAAGGRGVLEDVSRLMAETENVSRWSYLCTQFNVLVIYIRLLFLPVRQNLDYIYPFKNGFFDGLTPLAFLFLVGVVAVGLWNLRKRPLISLSIFGFFIALSVESSIIPIKDALFEHRLYLPMFSFALLLADLPYRFLSNRRNLILPVTAIIILSLGTATYARNRVWQDGITLWSDVVSKSPDNSRAYTNLGVELADVDRLPEAIRQYRHALRISPADPLAHNDLGTALNRQGLQAEAIAHFRAALQVEPNYTQARVNLANALKEGGQAEAAVDNFSEALRIDPENKEALVGLGNALQGERRIDEAIARYNKALRIDPDFKEAHYNLAIALFKRKDTAEAIDHFYQALRIDPNDPAVHTELGNALQSLGKLEEAADHYLRALDIDPKFKQAYFNLATLQQGQGRLQEAVDNYTKALQIDPDYKEAHFNLANILLAAGYPAEAVEHYRAAVRIDPDFFEAHNNMAAALMRMGRVQEAIVHFKEVLRITPDNPNARRNLAKAMERKAARRD